MISEAEARFFYKNKIVKGLNIASMIGMVLLSFLSLILIAISFIVEHGLSSIGWLYGALAFSVVGILLSAVLLSLVLINQDEGYSKARVRAIDIVKMILRIANLGCSVILLLGAYIGKLGSDAGNEPWAECIRIYAIIGLSIEAIMLLYGVWTMAWVKENPERFGSYSIAPIDKTPKGPKANKKKGKNAVKEIDASSPKAIENEPLEIEGSEVPLIEKISKDDVEVIDENDKKGRKNPSKKNK